MRGDEIAFVTAAGNGVHYVSVSQYLSGEPMVKEEFTPNLGNPIVRVMLRPKTTVGFLGGIFWVQSLIDRGFPAPELVVPSLFGARQDRINPEGDVLFTARNVAKLINSLGCPRVITLDPHSEVAPALIERCTSLHTDDIFAWLRWNASPVTFNFPEAVISPDAGAEKRAGLVAKRFGVPLLHAWKSRDVKDGHITGFGIEPCEEFRDKRLLIVDDLCDGGGTFVGLNAKLPAGALVDLYVTHGLFTKGTRELLLKFSHIYCTDSVGAPAPGVQIIPICDSILKNGV